jgi:hypothetical protein
MRVELRHVANAVSTMFPPSDREIFLIYKAFNEISIESLLAAEFRI